MDVIPDWVYSAVAIILIISTLTIAVRSNGGVKTPLKLMVIVIITVGYLFSLTFIKNVSPLLGLDLQGGVSIVLEAQGDFNNSDLDVAVDIIRNRVDAVGVAEPEITRQGSNIIVDLPGADNAQEAQELIGQTGELRFRQVAQNLDDPTLQQVLQQVMLGSQVQFELPQDLEEPQEPVNEDIETQDNAGGPGMSRVGRNSQGEQDLIQDTGSSINSVTLICGGNNPQEVVLEGDLTKPTPRDLDDPDKAIIALDRDGVAYLLCPTVLKGDIVKDARRSVDPASGNVNVGVELTNEGARQFTDLIGRPLSGQNVAIVLDSRVESAPTISPDLANGLTDNSLVITVGSQNATKVVDELSKILRHGSLDVVLEQQTAQQISATLGTDQLRAGIIAGAVGLFFVIIYMFLYYRVLVLVVIAGAGLVGFSLYALVSWLGVVQGLALTLAGAVGLIISMGVTLDSYIVYFEKIKDEMRQGKTLRASLDNGFKSAQKTIIAGNLVSLIGAVVLYYLAAGGVRGFAFFLGLSTLLDLVTSLSFMHPMVKVLAKSDFLVNTKFIGIKHALGVRNTKESELV